MSFEGRPLAYQLRVLSKRAKQSGGSHYVDDSFVKVLEDIIEFLQSYGPRRVKISGDARPVLLFTDGAVEEKATAGAVIYDPVDGTIEY